MPSSKKLKLTIPNGHLGQKSIEIFQKAYYKISGQDRSYRPAFGDPDVELRVLRPQEIPLYVADGIHNTVLEPDEIKARIERGLPGSKAEVAGAEAHFTAVVVAPAFEGKSRVEQHLMIYALFKDEMASQAIHALGLRTAAPSEPPLESEKEGR